MTFLDDLDTYHVVGNISLLDLLASAVIALVGFALVRLLVRGLGRVAHRRGMEDLMEAFVLRIVRVALDVVVVILALAPLHVDLTSAIVGFGVLGIVLGFALNVPLSNLAAGILLAIVRPFRKGDLILVAGMEGRVEDLGITSTTLRTLDNRRITVASTLLLTNPVTNFTYYPTRRIDLALTAGPGTDLQEVMGAILRVIQGDSEVLPEPAPEVHVKGLGDAASLEAHAWVATENYMNVRQRLLGELHGAIGSSGLAIKSPEK